MSFIKYLDYYIPEEKILVSEFINEIDSKHIPLSFIEKEEYEEFTTDILNLESFRVETKLTAVEMMSLLLEDLFASKKILREEIQLIILIQEDTIHGKYLGQQLQDKFNMENAFVLNIGGNSCCNFEMGLTIANSFITSNSSIQNVVILGCNKMLKNEDRIIGSYAINGDGAGLVVVSKEKGLAEIKDSVTLTKGMFHNVDLNQDHSAVHGNMYMKCIEQLMSQNNLTVNDVDSILIQNANPLLLMHSLAMLEMDTDLIYEANFGKYGHLDCIDFVVNLKDILNKNEQGKNILAFGSGWTGSYVSTLLHVQ